LYVSGSTGTDCTLSRLVVNHLDMEDLNTNNGIFKVIHISKTPKNMILGFITNPRYKIESYWDDSVCIIWITLKKTAMN